MKAWSFSLLLLLLTRANGATRSPKIIAIASLVAAAAIVAVTAENHLLASDLRMTTSTSTATTLEAQTTVETQTSDQVDVDAITAKFSSAHIGTCKALLEHLSGPGAELLEEQQQQQQEGDGFISTGSGATFWWQHAIQWSIHRNGEPDACGEIESATTTTTSPLEMGALQALEMLFPNCEMPEKDNADDYGLLDKYEVEAFLTQLWALQWEKSIRDDVNAPDAAICASNDNQTATPLGMLGYCDMGPDRTVIQYDYDDLVPVPSSGTLPCRFYTREGLRITSLAQLSQIAQRTVTQQQQQQQQECSATTDLPEPSADPSSSTTCRTTTATTTTTLPTLHLYAVPAGRVFMFAPSFVGETFVLDHVQDSVGETVTLTVLSTHPRVFDIAHFFTVTESDALVTKAVSETSPTHKFHRSTTGTVGASVYNKRTSENAWDTHGSTALAIKQRCFRLLGFDEYEEAMADGLQILRYNQTTAYIPHMDYLSDAPDQPYNYDSSGTGANRFATILLYMSELEEHEGGETVFTQGLPLGITNPKDKLPLKEAIRQLRASGHATSLQAGSWEEEMAATCRSRLAVRPYKTRAVLFYSQLPNGEEDISARHGGCPVLANNKPKMAANLWTWSGIRPEYPGAPLKWYADGNEDDNSEDLESIDLLSSTGTKQQSSPPPHPAARTASFSNPGTDSRFDQAVLYYDENGYFGELGPQRSISVNTYVGHVWNIKVPATTTASSNDGGNKKKTRKTKKDQWITIQTFIISETPQDQKFVLILKTDEKKE